MKTSISLSGLLTTLCMLFTTSTSAQNTHLDLTVNNLKTTVTAKGRIGYNDDAQTQGIGISLGPSGTLSNTSIGLMMGNSPEHLSSGTWSGYQDYDDDFSMVEGVFEINDGISDKHLSCRFNDSFAQEPLEVDIKQDVYAWSDPPDDDYFIIKYTIVNNSSSNWNDFYVGLHYETDLPVSTSNKATRYPYLKLAYAYNTDHTMYTGIRLLGNAPFNAFVYDWNDPESGIDLTDGFSKSEKLIAVQNNHPNAALNVPGGSNVGLVVSSGPYAFQSGDTIRVAFSVLANSHFDQLYYAAEAAEIRYENISYFGGNSSAEAIATMPAVDMHILPNPATEELQVRIGGTEVDSNAQITVCDLTGKPCPVQTERYSNQHFRIDVKNLPPGTYAVKYTSGVASVLKLFVKQ